MTYEELLLENEALRKENEFLRGRIIACGSKIVTHKGLNGTTLCPGGRKSKHILLTDSDDEVTCSGCLYSMSTKRKLIHKNQMESIFVDQKFKDSYFVERHKNDKRSGLRNGTQL